MLHLRVVTPDDLLQPVLDLVTDRPGVGTIAVLRGAAVSPAGHLVLIDCAREVAGDLVEELAATGLKERGSIALEEAEAVVSDLAKAAQRDAPGLGVDALVWEEVVARTSEDAQLSWSYLVFLVAASLVAGVGILTDSPILIVAAMVLGPEFGPLAGIFVAAVRRRWGPLRRSVWALVVGFPVAVLPTAAMALLVDAAGRVPDAYEEGRRPLTGFISRPDGWSVLVAVLAGVAGAVSLTASKSGALVGVVVSVTTIPAVANVGIAAVLGHAGEAFGALGQLAVNSAGLVLAGGATLLVQDAAARRRHFPRKATGGTHST